MCQAVLHRQRMCKKKAQSLKSQLHGLQLVVAGTQVHLLTTVSAVLAPDCSSKHEPLVDKRHLYPTCALKGAHIPRAEVLKQGYTAHTATQHTRLHSTHGYMARVGTATPTECI